MLYTEDEAKNRKCPNKPVNFLLQYEELVPTETYFARCCASNCMAWRVEYGLWHLGEERWLVEGDTFQPGEAVKKETGLGYCGLAGRPE